MSTKIIKLIDKESNREMMCGDSEFERGFCFTMKAMYLKGIKTKELLNYIEEIKELGELTNFDNGIEYALNCLYEE